MIVSSKKPSFKRYRELIFTRYSQMRFFEYEYLPNIHLKGKAIDIGGRRDADYYILFASYDDITTVNISDSEHGGANIIADCNEPLPVEDNSYDTLISLNTFEHIKNDELLLNECFRILKSDGEFHIFVPFLFREHGAPFDYHRHTSQWWEEKLQEQGLKSEDFTITPLVWDSIATGLSHIEEGFSRPIRMILRSIFLLSGLIKLLMGKNKNPLTMALGYFISGKNTIH